VTRKFTVLVCGGRDFGDLRGPAGNEDHPDHKRVCSEYNHTLRTLDRLALNSWPKTPEDEYGNWLPNVVIITGGASGVDSTATDWAAVNWCQFKEYKADWKKHGRAAGPIRNQRMLDEGKPDLVVAFPGGRGTADMVKRAKAAGVPVHEVT
jgi:SLOG family YspA-like protein